MKSIVILLCVFCSSISVFSQRQTTMPPPSQFINYPVREVFRGNNAKLVLTRADMSFRTRLRGAAQQKPNFAGHYILTAWGCGAECLMGAVIDARTGKVFRFDFTICCWEHYDDEKFEPIDYRLNSKLIIFSGLRSEKEGDRGRHYYKFENGKFIHLRTVLEENQ